MDIYFLKMLIFMLFMIAYFVLVPRIYSALKIDSDSDILITEKKQRIMSSLNEFEI